MRSYLSLSLSEMCDSLPVKYWFFLSWLRTVVVIVWGYSPSSAIEIRCFRALTYARRQFLVEDEMRGFPADFILVVEDDETMNVCTEYLSLSLFDNRGVLFARTCTHTPRWRSLLVRQPWAGCLGGGGKYTLGRSNKTQKAQNWDISSSTPLSLLSTGKRFH